MSAEGLVVTDPQASHGNMTTPLPTQMGDDLFHGSGTCLLYTSDAADE